MPDPEFKTMDDFLEQGNEPETEQDPVEEKTPTPATEPEVDPTPDPKNNEGEEDNDGEEGSKEPKANKAKVTPNPMKELRDKANAAAKAQQKIDDAINRLSDGEYDFKLKDFKNENGKVDYDALIEAMDAEDVKKRAESRGLSPEMQAEIEKYEREKKAVEIEKARVQMDRQLNNFQMEQQLSPDDLNNFIADAMKLGINPLSIAALDKSTKGTVALKMLYKAVYTDKIVQEAVTKALADAEAKREADAAAKGNQPKTNPANPNNNKTNKQEPKGLALEEFLGGL